MKPAKIKGIRKYLVRTMALVYASWEFLTVNKKDLEVDDVDRKLLFTLVYRRKAMDTYNSYTLEEMGTKITKPFDADKITLKNFEGIFKCKKKPMIVHAVQLNYPEGFKVTTMEGEVIGKPGDYLMFGVNGEKYPCNKEIFKKSYEKVNK